MYKTNYFDLCKIIELTLSLNACQTSNQLVQVLNGHFDSFLIMILNFEIFKILIIFDGNSGLKFEKCRVVPNFLDVTMWKNWEHSSLLLGGFETQIKRWLMNSTDES